jgi:hypothetical protein
MVINLIRSTRARVAQFAAAHRYVYALAAIAFAVLVGWEVRSLSTIERSAPVETPDEGVFTGLADNERAVTIPHTFAPLLVRSGDNVDVAVWVDPVMGEARPRLIGPARVTAIGPDSTLVAVDASDVIDIVEALSVGSVMVVPRASQSVSNG